MTIKTYTELSKFSTFKERYEYLKLTGHVAEETFGSNRYLNQMFYKSPEWLKIRDEVIVRDHGCDLGVEGYEIYGRILIHHINPITDRDIVERSSLLLDPEYLISVTHETHNFIHYGVVCGFDTVIDRHPNDTCPWKG